MPCGVAWKGQKLPHFLSSGSPPEPFPSAKNLTEDVMFGKPGRFLALCAVCFFAAGNAIAQGWQHIGNVRRVTKLSDGVELTAGKAKVRITAVRDDVFRVRVAADGNFPKDFSWAVIGEVVPPAVKIEEASDSVKIS